jgi:hypothetical protein
MMMDKQLEFSVAQAVTNTAASTEYVDQGAAGDALTPGARFVARVGTAFANATSMDIALQTDDNSSFTSAKTLWSSGAIAEADLTLNKIVADLAIPSGAERYLRAYYTVSGTHNAGTIDAFIVLDSDINNKNQA